MSSKNMPANETGAEGADALAHEVWSAAQRAPGEGIEDAVQRIAAILSRSPAMAAEAVGWFDKALNQIRWRDGLVNADFRDGQPFYTQPEQAVARVGLTDEQRKAIKWAARATSNLATREALMALLQGANHA